MPTGPRPKGPRLWLEPERKRPGREPTPSAWTIRDDGGFKQRLACGPDDRRSAEEELENYLARKRTIPPGERDPAQRLTADVLALYLRDIAPDHARPAETASRVQRLDRFWSNPAFAMRVLAEQNRAERMTGHVEDITTSSCRGYVQWVGKQRTAAVDLALLKSAINHAVKEKKLAALVPVWLPEKGAPRDRWLTRSEAAAIIWKAWRERGSYEGSNTAARPSAHVARFLLIALYTGKRKSAALLGAFERVAGFGYIDLDKGLWYPPAGKRRTNKRQEPQPIPDPLLAHMRRWRKNGQRFPVEYHGEPVKRVDKAVRRIIGDLGFDDVVIHTFRHTAITWGLQGAMPPWDAAGYFSVSSQVIDKVYGHHSPAHLREAAKIMGRLGRAPKPKEKQIVRTSP